MSRDLVYHKKTVMVQNRYQKWKERVEFSKNVNFETTDIYVRDFTVIFMLKKFTEIIWKTAAGWHALLC